MLSKEEIENILDVNEEIITYKADKDFRCLTSTEKALLENNNKIKQYIEQLESNNQKLIEKLEEVIDDDEMSDIEYQMKRELAIEILNIAKGEKE